MKTKRILICVMIVSMLSVLAAPMTAGLAAAPGPYKSAPSTSAPDASGGAEASEAPAPPSGAEDSETPVPPSGAEASETPAPPSGAEASETPAPPSGAEASETPVPSDGAEASETPVPSGSPAVSPGAPAGTQSPAVSEPPVPARKFTLTDLVEVSAYLAGREELTADEMKEFDLTGDGEVTVSDLVQMAQDFRDEHAPVQLPEADPQYATISLVGEITAVDAEDGTWTVKEDSPESENEIVLLPSETCMIIDAQTGLKADASNIKEGDDVHAFIGSQMMPSLPAKAQCYALIVNLPDDENKPGNWPNYIRASEVTANENGSVRILNQNADLYVTIPADVPLSVYGEADKTAEKSEIKEGSRLIVWYDLVATSYPAQTTALRAVIDLTAETTPQPSEEPSPAPTQTAPSESAEPSAEPSATDEPQLPTADPQFATKDLVGEITAVSEEDGTFTMKEDSPDAVDEVVLIKSDDLMIVDAQSGAEVDEDQIKAGDRVHAFVGSAMNLSLPPQTQLYALIVNLPDEENMPGNWPTYVRVSEAATNENGSVTVLNQNADLYVTIPADVELGVYGEPDKKAEKSDIKEGSRIIAWFDVVAESYPAQATALRAVIDLSEPSDVNLPEADPAVMTLSIVGEIQSIDTEADTWFIKDEDPEAKDELGLIPSEDCMIIDCQTGLEVEKDQLKVGDRICAFVGSQQMPSLPPKAQCAAIITNLPAGEDGTGWASYEMATEVTAAEDGSVQILNQNKDMYITFPADMQLSVYGEADKTAPVSSIKEGSRMIVWYDIVLMSYPGRTTALRAVIDLDD